jgi:tetratricopeptide (TPR) repeat protein
VKRTLATLAALCALAGCTRAPQRAVERLAILPFENLTGDASLDWIRAAGPAILAEQVAGSARLFPVSVPTLSEAAFAGATRYLHCNFSRIQSAGAPAATGPALRFSFAIEDAATHKMVTSGTSTGAVLFAMNTLALALDPAAQPFSSGHADAVAAWGHGDFERALSLDPDFGAAWISSIEQLARSAKPEDAAAAADEALARASLRSPLERARIQLLLAGLHKDQPAREAALAALAGLAPTDAASVLALAEAEQRRRHFPASAALYRRVLALEPGNAGAMNGLGYAEGEAGRLDAARVALEQYARQPNQAANALDSLGEVYFMNGRFAEAEKYFSQVNAKDPAFMDGAALVKAAYAHWLAARALSPTNPGGDLAGADAILRRYLDSRAQANDPSVIWREAAWLYTTGRPRGAIAKLASAPDNQKALLDRQLAVWRGEIHPPTDPAEIKAVYDSTNPAADGLIRVIYAAALLGEGKTDQARALLERWPLPESAGDPLLQSLVFPQFLELRKKLGVK